MPVGTDAAHEKVDAPVRLDLRLIARTLRLQVFGIAVQDIDVLLGDVDVTEKVVPHKAVVALGVVFRDVDVFVHIEGHDVLEGDLPLLVQVH